MKATLLLALGSAGVAVLAVVWVRSRAEHRAAQNASPGVSQVRETVARANPTVGPQPDTPLSVDSAEIHSAALPQAPARGSARRPVLPGIIRVKVLDELGQPMPSADVLAARADRERSIPAAPALRSPADGDEARAKTDETGIAELGGLSAGSWRVWGGREGWFHHFSPVLDFDPQHEGLEVELRLTRIPESQFIEGIVLDPAGAPALGTSVAFYWKAGETLRMTSTDVDRSGHFTLVLDEKDLVGALLVSTYRGSQLRTELLDPFMAGQRDLEVRLAVADPMTIDIRDVQDLPVEPGQCWIRFSLDVLGHWEDPSRAGHRRGIFSEGTHERPPVPFLVHLSCGLGPQTFGPFRPEEVGDVLVLRMASSRTVRGRVTWNGTPVEGAFVALFREKQPAREFSESLAEQGRFIRGADSDARGEFAISIRQSDRCVVRATKLPLGSGQLGPVFVDAERGLEGLEIVLTDPPGEIRGRVIAPEGRAPDQIALVFATIGDRFLLQPDPEGSFQASGLAVGAWTLRACSSPGLTAGILYRNSFSFYERPPEWLLDDAPVHVVLGPGAIAEVALDLSRKAPCQLQGRIRLTGTELSERPRDDFLEQTVCLALESGSTEESRSALGADGNFRIGSRAPGPHRLRIELELQRGREEVIVLDRVDMVDGTRTWEHDIPTGELRVRVAPELWKRGPVEHRWRGAEELRVICRSPIRSDPDKTYVFSAVPAGRGEIELQVSGEDRRSTPVDVPAGGVAEVELR